MNESMADRKAVGEPNGGDRRARKPDLWRRVLNWLTYLVYPLLLLNLFVFMAVTSEDQADAMAAKMKQSAEQVEQTEAAPAAQPVEENTAGMAVNRWVQVHAFLPLMLAGMGIGVLGIVLDRMRSRRRSDSSLMTPLVLIVFSVVGLLVYLAAAS